MGGEGVHTRAEADGGRGERGGRGGKRSTQRGDASFAEVEATSPGRCLSDGLSRQRFASSLSLSLQLLSWDQGHVDLRARFRGFRRFFFR